MCFGFDLHTIRSIHPAYVRFFGDCNPKKQDSFWSYHVHLTVVFFFLKHGCVYLDLLWNIFLECLQPNRIFRQKKLRRNEKQLWQKKAISTVRTRINQNRTVLIK